MDPSPRKRGGGGEQPGLAATTNENQGASVVNMERFVQVMQACFANLAKSNGEQMSKLQTAVESIGPKAPVADKETNFWNLYNTIADEHDKEFVEKYITDLDTSLIFAGLFSAISSAFIIQIQPELQPDPNDTNQALMRILIHAVNSTMFSGADLSIPTSFTPPHLVVVAQSLLYISLCSTLLAALLAVLGKQWVMYYSAAGERGTIEARGLERQRKFDGLRKWKFEMLMQMFPLLLQLGLLLFAAALSVYLWTIHFSLAIIILCFTTFGFTSYVLLLISSLVSPDSPFQTPLSLLVALVIPRTFWMGFGSFLVWATAQTWAFVQHQIDRTHDFLPYFSKLIDPSPPPVLDPEDPEPSAEIPAVLWILEASTDPRAVAIAAEMVGHQFPGMPRLHFDHSQRWSKLHIHTDELEIRQRRPVYSCHSHWARLRIIALHRESTSHR
ncbi:hypothetical protein B0H14DRAFT_3867493 [Mycena olivaceomarginata]|nr:hypothetical protein B0H14DRAFT_3867493 [Mycena olivaceomarginata]